MRWSHLHGDMQGQAPDKEVPSAHQIVSKAISEIPCRVRNTCPAAPRGAAARPAHIGEAFLAMPDGDPEGSPSDPVTTDPKGEACRGYAACNTPALTKKGSLRSDDRTRDRHATPTGPGEVKG
jgi:hypothetical protein